MTLQPLLLADAHARAEIFPSIGGAVGRYDIRRNDTYLPIFQTAPHASRSGPFALGCQVMVPFANRISGGGFAHGGAFHPLAPNLDGEPYPNHGNGFQLPWQVASASDTEISLTLHSVGPGSFAYDAVLQYSLDQGALTMRLTLTNRAAIALPHGAGFHPWFVRSPQTRLGFDASGVWSERPDHLPDQHHAIGDIADFDFRHAAPLPDRWINNAFTGWDGIAVLEWPERNVAVTLTAAAPLRTLMVYSPGPDAGYVCVEPVSHSVDAHNRSGPGVAPPQLLPPGAELVASMTITPQTKA